MKKAVRYSCLLFSGYLLIFGIAPLFFGILHAGMWAMALFGALLLSLTLSWAALSLPGWRRMLRNALAAALAAAFAAGAALSGCMIVGGWLNPPPDTAQTVLVLGCQVVGDQPSVMLRHRLDAALGYLNEHPEAHVVVSGGVDSGERLSEAAVMQRYLLAHGIAKSRIFLEDRSRNTDQNVKNSTEIIRANGLPTSVAIATDGFHQLRGALYARRNGLEAYALPAVSPWGLFPSYWVRELFAIVRAVVLPNAFQK